MRILLSRTDSIGDVMLTLPMAGFIKKYLADSVIHFLGRSYTKAVIESSEHIDEFINWDEFEGLELTEIAKAFSEKKYDVIIHVFPNRKIAQSMKQAGIKMRIGTAGRFFHLAYCNKLVKFTRKKSDLHEAQLNLKLLKPLSIPTESSIEELIKLTGFTKFPQPGDLVKSLVKQDKINLILHPKSKGSAVEWGLENFSVLMKMLPSNQFHLFVSGTEEDKKSIGNALPLDQENVTSLLGKLSLTEFISFISLSDGLISASTGPLHISAALGKVAIGLYSSRKPIHPGRWRPIGINAHAIVYDENCSKCGQGKSCDCILKIDPRKVVDALNQSFDGRF